METKLAKCILLLGVGSNAGKTVLGDSLCRLIKASGRRVNVFKALSVDQESLRTADGGLIGRHLRKYFDSCGTEPAGVNNPCFYDLGARQLHLYGEPAWHCPLVSEDNVDLSSLSAHSFQSLRSTVEKALAAVRQTADWVVIEGSGCCTDESEYDIANAHLAEATGAQVVLVAGGLNGGYASAIVGTVALLPPPIREQLAGFVCNQLDRRHAQVERNLNRIEAATGVPCLGALPNLELPPGCTHAEWCRLVDKAVLAGIDLGSLSLAMPESALLMHSAPVPHGMKGAGTA